jgi:serine/threonine protein kinase
MLAEVWVGPSTAPDTYLLATPLGGGGEGEVWKAELPLSAGGRRTVAVKIVQPRPEPEAEQLWERSGYLLRGLSHPGLVRVTDVFRGPLMHAAGRADHRTMSHYVVMDHIEGLTLTQWLSEHPGAGSRMRLSTLRTVAAALDEMHSGASTQVPVVHGDVKPANVVVRADGSAVLVDLGLTRLTDATGIAGLSAPYAAPEMRGGLPLPTPESDAFSFVATVAQALTGHRPPTDEDGWLDIRALESELRASPATAHQPTVVRHVIDALLAPPYARPRRLRAWLDAAGQASAPVSRPAVVATAEPEPMTVTVPVPRSAPQPELDVPAEARPSARPRRRAAIGLLAVAVLSTVAVVMSVSPTTAAFQTPVAAVSTGAEIVREPVGEQGPDPFTGSVALAERPLLSPTVIDPTTGPSGVQIRGDRPGLYSGTRSNGSCDAARLVTFLQANPAKASAWAGVLNIGADQVAASVAGLTPVVLRADTRVTIHGFRDGRATPLQSILQAGTAVLVDQHGVPRVKCGSGNPLTDPVPQPAGVTFRGAAWLGSDRPPIVVAAAPALLSRFTLADVTTGRPVIRPLGTNGQADSDPGPIAPTATVAPRNPRTPPPG